LNILVEAAGVAYIGGLNAYWIAKTAWKTDANVAGTVITLAKW
tara:strand:+ start:408 stop:536 length:129 start_codon:yes stop_codon:yes gene_type:complete